MQLRSWRRCQALHLLLNAHSNIKEVADRNLRLRPLGFIGSSAMNSIQETNVSAEVPRRSGLCGPPPQNCFLHNALQGITCEQFTVHNEMLGHCRMEQLIGSSGAKDTAVERHDTGRTALRESGPGLRTRPRPAAWTRQDSREPRRVPPHPVAIPGTGPHGALRALGRPELRRQERTSD